MKNKTFFKQFIKGLVVTTVFAVSLFAGSGTAHAQDSGICNIIFDQNQLFPVVLTQNNINIQPGLATVDMNKLNVGHDPEAIKAYMQQIAPQYGVDWKLVYAIGVYESGNYNSSLARYSNNFFGRKANSTSWMSYNTAQEGIQDQFKYVKEHYINNGLDTPQKMNHIYCEGNTWQYKVQFIMDTI